MSVAHPMTQFYVELHISSNKMLVRIILYAFKKENLHRNSQSNKYVYYCILLFRIDETWQATFDPNPSPSSVHYPSEKFCCSRKCQQHISCAWNQTAKYSNSSLRIWRRNQMLAILFKPTDCSASILVNWITRQEHSRVEGKFRPCAEKLLLQ